MVHPTDVVGLASAACALAALFLSLPGVSSPRRRWPAATLTVALALPLIPLPELPAAGYLRGVIGDLSMTTTLLLGHHLLRPVLRLAPVGERSRVALQALVAAGGLLLYPLTLGFGAADPYRLGFAHAGFVWTLLFLALAAWCGRLHLVASCLAIGVAAWAVGALESRNLWDYLLDPVVTAWALGALGWRLVRRSRRVGEDFRANGGSGGVPLRRHAERSALGTHEAGASPTEAGQRRRAATMSKSMSISFETRTVPPPAVTGVRPN